MSARANPRRRARALWCSGSLSARIEIKTTLSMPSTISSSVSVSSAIRFSGLNKTSKRLRPFSGGQSEPCYPVIQDLARPNESNGFRLLAEPALLGGRQPAGGRGMPTPMRESRVTRSASSSSSMPSVPGGRIGSTM